MSELDDILSRHDVRTLEDAVRKRRRLEERKVGRLRRKRKRLQRDLAKVERELERATAAARRSKDGSPKRRPNARRLNDISLGDALEKVLARRTTPMHYRDLTEAVVSRGLYRTRSKNLLSTVAVTLKRDRRFRKMEPGYYALR